METKHTDGIEVKVVRIRDIAYHHLKKQNPNATIGDINDLEHDIAAYMKNLMLALESLDAHADVRMISHNDKTKGPLVC